MIGRWRKKKLETDLSSEPIVVEGFAKGSGGRARNRVRMPMRVFLSI